MQRLPVVKFSSGEIILILSEGDNVPKATTFQPSFQMHPKYNHALRLYTKTVNKTPTRRYPCSKEWTIVCKEKERFEEIKRKENCWIPLLYSGPHLKFNKGLKKCNETITRKYIHWKPPSKCPISTPCQYTRYNYDHFTRKLNNIGNDGSLEITMKPLSFTESSDTQWAFINVLTEMGGLFGVTHGWSAFSLVEGLYNAVTALYL